MKAVFILLAITTGICAHASEVIQKCSSTPDGAKNLLLQSVGMSRVLYQGEEWFVSNERPGWVYMLSSYDGKYTTAYCLRPELK